MSQWLSGAADVGGLALLDLPDGELAMVLSPEDASEARIALASTGQADLQLGVQR